MRHGDYNRDGHLSDRGREQMAKMAEYIKVLLGDQSGIILSSTADRAKESANVLANLLNCDKELHELLWSQADRRENLPAALELIRSRGANFDVVVVVTHLEYAERLPNFIDGECFHYTGGFPFWEIPKGTGWLIDMKEGTCEYLNPGEGVK